MGVKYNFPEPLIRSRPLFPTNQGTSSKARGSIQTSQRSYHVLRQRAIAVERRCGRNPASGEREYGSGGESEGSARRDGGAAGASQRKGSRAEPPPGGDEEVRSRDGDTRDLPQAPIQRAAR